MSKLSCSFGAAATLLFFVNNVITTSALQGGYEQVHTYNYAAKINVGVEGHVSEYYIDGLLKMQRDGKSNIYMLALSDLKYSSYFGVDNLPRVSESNPTDFNVLQIPFYVEYFASGQLIYAKTDKKSDQPTKEPGWSQKIKKSIASLFEFNWAEIQYQMYKNDSETTKQIYSNVGRTHGTCEGEHIVKDMSHPANPKEKFLMTTAYSLNMCDDFTRDASGYLTNYKITQSAIGEADKWDSSSIRNAYELDVIKGIPKVKRISNFESYVYSDNIDDVVFIKDNRPLFVKIRQNLILNSTSPEDRLFEDFKKNPDQFYSLYDTKTSDSRGLGDKIADLLIEARTYMEKNHLSVIDEGAEHRQVFNKILSFLKRLEPTDFTNLMSKIEKNPNSNQHRNLLVSILPYAATKHSFDFALDLISKKLISDDMAIQFLTTFPVYGPRDTHSIDRLESLVFDSDKSSLLLSSKVHEVAVTSFSQVANTRCDGDARTVKMMCLDTDAEKFVPIINDMLRAAKTTTSKLAYLSAIGHYRSGATAEYLLPIWTQKSSNAKDQDRLRLAAININILSEYIDLHDDIFYTPLHPKPDRQHVKRWVYSNLTTILKDKSESKAIRLAAYDVLISKTNYAINNFTELGGMLSDERDLYNYHLSTVEELEQVGLLDRGAKVRIDPSKTAVSSSLSKTVILKMDNLVKPEFWKSTLKLQLVPQTYLKLSLVSGEQLTNSDWRIPSMVKFEVLEKRYTELVVIKAVYLYTNFNGKNVDEGIFFDLWSLFDENSRPCYVETIEFENLPSLLELSDVLLEKIRGSFNFMYQELTSFSLKTGFGDVVFEHKYPSLVSTFMDYNWNADENYLETKIDFSLKSWSNGYSGVSMFNPLSGLTHSIRKTQLVDGQLSTSVIIKYDFSKHQFNLTIPVNVKDPESKWTGLAIYSSTTVGITDANDEISCKNCGFEIASTDGPRYNLNFHRNDYLELLASHMTYNCDPQQRLDEQTLFGNSNDDEVHAINTCGYIAMIQPNSSKPSSQIELLIDVDPGISKSMEKPWHFLPGYKLNFESSIGTRRIISNEVNHLLKLGFKMSSSQGHFSNLLQFKVVKKNDDNSNFIVCFDGKADFPETDDNHLPNEITQSKLNAFSRFKIGKSEVDDSCPSVDFAIDFDLTGEVSEMQRSVLEKSASESLCMLQHVKWLYVYLREGSYPLTEACVREMISNTTLRRYKLDLTSEQFSELSLLPALMVIKNAQDKLKEMIANSHNVDVEVKMVSPLADIRTRKRISFQADYPMRDIYKNLPNMYFSQEFVLDFLDKKINVINIYPGMMVFNNEEKPLPESNEWMKIDTGIENTPYQIYTSAANSVSISLKILFKGYELILKPKLIDSTKKSYIPQIYYNQQFFSDFRHRLHLFSSQEILFR
uniref:Vg3 n=1 Tax=Tetrastichus brontispae TaxID=2033808 RepID=A0A650FXJ0_9HYME|nr:Vg3 [Tetrastichus brontispae]